MSKKIFISSLFFLTIDVSWSLTDTKAIDEGQFPSYASIVVKLPAVKELPVCGGVIINERYVLTSGQCDCVSLKPTIGLLRVKVGVHTRYDTRKFVQFHNVDKVIINKKLKNGLFLTIKEYDIGLLKLTDRITFNERVQPVKLPHPHSLPTGKATVIGLGATDGLLIPSFPNKVQQIEVELIDRAECTKTIKGYSILNNKLLDKQLCSKPVNHVATACKGDSGDPLYQIQGKDHVLIGLLTWAPYPCRQTNAPIVYTSVSEYIDWIHEKIKEYGA